jgi:hypothetical protein
MKKRQDHRTSPDDEEILRRSLGLAYEALQAAEIQLERAREPASDRPGGAFQWWIDLQFFVVALRRLRRAADLMSNVQKYRPQIEQALDRLDAQSPYIELFRNVGEHIDAYTLGEGWDDTVEPPSLAVGEWDKTTYGWLGLDLNTETSIEAAKVFVADLHAIRDRDLEARVTPGSQSSGV